MTTPLPPDSELAPGQPILATHLKAIRDYSADAARQALAPSDQAADFAVTRAENAGRLVARWKANTAYAAGQPVLNPDGELVKAQAAFTSGAIYDATKWSTPASALYGPTSASSTLLAYDRFDRYADGPLSGVKPLVGPTYVTTGVAPTQVVGGAATANGTGYLFLGGFSLPVSYVEQVVSWTSGTGSLGSSATMAFAKDTVPVGGNAALDDLIHPAFGPNGFTLTVRKAGGSFDALISANWRSPCKTDGTRYRMGLAVRGNTVTVIGPNGERISATDARIGPLAVSRSVFWEPVQSGTGTARCLLHEIRVLSYPEAAGQATSLSSPLDALAAESSWRTFVESAAQTWWQVRTGQHPQNGHPAIVVGPRTGDLIRTTLVAPANAGATSLLTQEPLAPGSTVVGVGATDGETVTVTGNPSPLPGAGSSYTATLSAPLVKSYPFGAAVWGPGYGSGALYFNKFSPVAKLFLDQATCVEGDVYVGNAQDVRLSRSSAGVLAVALGAGSAAAGKGAFRFVALTTANRPDAATVGVGATVFDTTLNRLVTSDGAAWRDGTGAIV